MSRSRIKRFIPSQNAKQPGDTHTDAHTHKGIETPLRNPESVRNQKTYEAKLVTLIYLSYSLFEYEDVS